MLLRYLPSGSTAPSRSERRASGMIFPTSKTASSPSPLQCGQAPFGELNEKVCGAGSSKATPVEGHIRWRE